MYKRFSEINAFLFLSVAFTLFLLAFRALYWGQVSFLFYLWNLFLAIIPLIFSRYIIRQKSFHFLTVTALACWLLFLPNAPYIITDIFHFEERLPVPKWFDLLLVVSAAWNGLLIGIVSLLQVEAFLKTQLSAFAVNIIMFTTIFSSAFGIYLGRFLRFNSWDVFTDTINVSTQVSLQFLHPHAHLDTWAFTFFFGAMLWLVYYTIKKLPLAIRQIV